jgi:hypothetical protein
MKSYMTEESKGEERCDVEITTFCKNFEDFIEKRLHSWGEGVENETEIAGKI